MLTWLGSLLGFFTGIFKTLWNDLINIIRAVDGYLESRIAQLQRNDDNLYNTLVSLSRSLGKFVIFDFNPFVGWVDATFNAVVRRENDDYNRLVNFINDLSRKTSQQITIVQQSSSNGLADLLKWVIQHIFDPLFGDVTKALDWIAHEGAYLLGLLASADRLLLWIFHFLFSQWPSLLDKFGKLALTWFLKSWKTVLPILVTVLEDIISAVLLKECHAKPSPVKDWDAARAASCHAASSGHGICSLSASIHQAQASNGSFPCHLG